MKIKKLFAIPMALIFSVTMAACGGGESVKPTPSEAAVAYPTKSIRIIVPYAAGGTGDIMSRSMSEILSKNLGVSVVVENKNGGGGAIAISDMLSNDADGYNIMETAIGPVALNPILNHLDFSFEDVRPICSILDSPCVILSSVDSDIKTWEDLMQKAESNPGAVTYGTAGTGSIHHVAFESILYKMEKTDAMTQVSFDGGAQALTALMGGKIDVYVGSLSDAMGNLEAGAFNVLAQCGEERIESLADVPTLKELGVDFSYTMWSGFFCSVKFH